MAKYGKKSQEMVKKAMEKLKEGKLKSGKSGKKVTSRSQAIAIGLSKRAKKAPRCPGLENRDLKMRRFLVLICLFASLSGAGCGTLQNGRGWGEDAFSSPTLERVGQSAYRALLDWQTLVPAAGALLLRIDNWDQKISDWAGQHHPLFGSERGARNAGDIIYAGSYVEAYGTSFATPSGEDSGDWVRAKAKGIGVELLAFGLTGGTTLLLRETTHRTSPDGTYHYVFPSGHEALGVGNFTLSNRNLDYIAMSDEIRTPIQAGNIALGAVLGWSRVEGRAHFPTDVLVGAALGHFLNAFIYDAFMGLPESKNFGISVTPQRGGAILNLFFSF